jgi:hypothetical protein
MDARHVVWKVTNREDAGIYSLLLRTWRAAREVKTRKAGRRSHWKNYRRRFFQTGIWAELSIAQMCSDRTWAGLSIAQMCSAKTWAELSIDQICSGQDLSKTEQCSDALSRTSCI